jgi:hypothetical protein
MPKDGPPVEITTPTASNSRAVLRVAGVARAIPGIRTGERELRFHIQRDADQYAVRTLHDPLSLASAICKAAGAPGIGLAG